MSESSPGGFGVVYPVLKAMEESGRIRRGYFVAGLGATQFALPGALDLLRSLRDSSAGTDEDARVVVLSATDPANPYGSTLKFPASGSRSPARIVGATVILVDGAIAAWLARGDRQLVTFLPEGEPERTKQARAIAQVLIDRARAGDDSPRGMLIEEIDGRPPAAHPLAPFLAAAGFVGGALGFQATFHARR
jgi:ATP-dependent Lhr-like helicase